MNINLPFVNQLLQINKNANFIFLLDDPDIADQVHALCSLSGKNITFMDLKDNPLYYNPMELDSISLARTLPILFKPKTSKEKLLMYFSIKVLKALYKDKATLLDLNTLIWNPDGGAVKRILTPFCKLSTQIDVEMTGDSYLSYWFNQYYSSLARDCNNKVAEESAGFRLKVLNFLSNDFVIKYLNPPRTNFEYYKEYKKFQKFCKKSNRESDLHFLTEKENTVQIILIENIYPETKNLLEYMYYDINCRIYNATKNKTVIPTTYVFSCKNDFLMFPPALSKSDKLAIQTEITNNQTQQFLLQMHLIFIMNLN